MAQLLDKENADPTRFAAPPNKAAVPLSALRSRIKGLLVEEPDQTAQTTSSDGSTASPEATADVGGHTLTSSLCTPDFAVTFLGRVESECQRASAHERHSRLSAAYRSVTNSIGNSGGSKGLSIWLRHAQLQAYVASAGRPAPRIWPACARLRASPCNLAQPPLPLTGCNH
jgi:hypothetical protein